MEIKVVNNEIIIDVSELLDNMTAERIAELAEQIGCQRQVQDAIIQQLTDGCTEGNSYFSDVEGMRERVIKAMDKIAAAKMEELQRKVDWLKSPHWVGVGMAIPGLASGTELLVQHNSVWACVYPSSAFDQTMPWRFTTYHGHQGTRVDKETAKRSAYQMHVGGTMPDFGEVY